MRISDWSSDVCSSDLVDRLDLDVDARVARHRLDQDRRVVHFGRTVARRQPDRLTLVAGLLRERPRGREVAFDQGALDRAEKGACGGDRRAVGRSEEHTSELQSLMRLSYAVFCLT